ncbi:hypothetical protein [Aureimonas glaciei]|uniref:HNH endonuclease n=1 Tax=Aureimonas glaciei TaxID=1776957 RepID=A0A916YFB7_9HYPH|nr:hypothetical protein [Aureimonas glaciei]GGD43056.1 hypothetical protein GCM10011335_52140 [Aureimonas glaciei]
MARREFTPMVYAQIVHRASNAQGRLTCEGCGLVLGRKAYHVDHTKPDGLEVDKTRKLTAEDGKVLGVECCHKPKTKTDVAQIAEAKRREAKHLGMTTRQPSRFPGSKASGLKKTIDGRVIDRATGEEIRR